MSLATTRARRGAMILERIAEERVRRGRRDGRPPARVGSGRLSIRPRDVPDGVAGQEAVMTVLGLGVQKDPGFNTTTLQYAYWSKATHIDGPVLGAEVFTESSSGIEMEDFVGDDGEGEDNEA